MAEMSKDRERELKEALDSIEKQMGKGTIMRLGDHSQQPIDGISTGSLALDIALGGKGVPRGRIIEIFGAESSGKTTIALSTVAQAQKAGGVAAYIDAEHALDPSWAKRIGVDLENLLISQPQCAEDALRIAELLIDSNAVDVIVIDSVAALVPKAEIDGEIGDSHVGLQARLMSQALRILNPKIGKRRTSLVFINQIRQKVGVFFGSPDTTPGGLALRFYSSVRMDVSKGEAIKKSEERIGNFVKVKVVKNKVAPPFKNAQFELLYETGVSKEGDVLLLAQEDKLIDKKGNYWYYGDIGLGNGWDKAKEYLRENPATMEEMTTKILTKRKLLNPVVQPNTIGDEEGPPPDAIPAPPPPPSPRRRGSKAAAATAAPAPAEEPAG